MNQRHLLLQLLYVLLQLVSGIFLDQPCRAYQANATATSVVCVCTAEYCDQIIRQPPLSGRYVSYVSSQGGLRFSKEILHLEDYVAPNTKMSCNLYTDCNPILELKPDKTFQTIEGFGGAVTDAAGINWDSLASRSLKKHLIDSYFSSHGIEYNMMRLPIGGTDFSTRAYTYNDLVDDIELSSFALAAEDILYKIPMIKAAFKVATADVHIVSAAWTAPIWMKDRHSFIGGYMQPKYFHTYTNYLIKFLEKYKEAGIPIWAISTGNEPMTGLTRFPINSMAWEYFGMGDWLLNSFGPTVRNSTFKDIKILAIDDQRPYIPLFIGALAQYSPVVMKYVDGIAVHFYMDDVTPPEIIPLSLANYPDLFVINTEACEGSEGDPVHLGDWSRAEHYIHDILEDLNYNLVGWIDWNMVLNYKGGPSYQNNEVDSPIIVAKDKKSFYKQPLFYAMGHFSKFIPRGSKRIQVDDLCSISVDANVAFITPKETIVVVLFNKKNEEVTANVKLRNEVATVRMPPKSIATVEIPYKNDN